MNSITRGNMLNRAQQEMINNKVNNILSHIDDVDDEYVI